MLPAFVYLASAGIIEDSRDLAFNWLMPYCDVRRGEIMAEWTKTNQGMRQ